MLEVLSCADPESVSNADCRPWTLDASDADGAFFPLEKSDLDFSALGLSHPPTAPTENAPGFSLVLRAHAYETEPHLDQQRLRGVVPVSGPDGNTHLAVDVPITHAGDADPAAFEVVVALPSQPAASQQSEGAKAPSGLSPPSLAWALVLGLIGGLILNLMPCVLPVLAIKVFGIADLARAERRHVLQHGFAYLTGVLASMAVLAAVVVGLRAAGTAVGWGFQLQDPIFLAVICTVLVIFAMNLFGAFEITLQPSGPDLGPTTGPAPPARSFFEGSLAVALATPCTAPFLGTAVGFAFASSGVVIFAVFAAIGVGLAAPYVLVTLVPGAARLVPRPGAWMLRVRQVLGFSLLATVVWLAWVTGRAIGVDAQALLLAHLVVIAFPRLGLRRRAGQRAPHDDARLRRAHRGSRGGVPHRIAPRTHIRGHVQKSRGLGRRNQLARLRPFSDRSRACRGATGICRLHCRLVHHVQGQRSRGALQRSGTRRTGTLGFCNVQGRLDPT